MLLEFIGWVLMLGGIGVLLAAYTTGDLAKLRWQLKWRWESKKKFLRIWFKYHYILITKSKGKHLWYVLTRKCPRCQIRGKISLRHQNCAYVDEMSNYYYMCEDCHQEIHDMYQDWWDEYNAGRL